jgi:hypothetical protein
VLDRRSQSLFLDAIYLPVRPSGPKEGVMCAWGFEDPDGRLLAALGRGAPRAIGGLIGR